MDKEKFTVNGEVGLSQKAFIFKDGKFLTIRRTETAPSNALKWDLPGGIIEFGEDIYDSIKREVKEETGLIIENPKPFDVSTRIHRDNEYWLTIAHRADVVGGELEISWEHDLHQWVTIDEFLELPASSTLIKFAKTLQENT